MKKLAGRAAAALVAVVLAGCAATGVKVTEEQLSALKPGETTEAQVIQALGSPTTRMRLQDGTSMLMYTFAEARIRPSSFIPIVGAFAGGSDVRSNSVTLRFDRSGVLIGTTSAESAMGTGTGLAAGTVSSEPIQQPRR